MGNSGFAGLLCHVSDSNNYRIYSAPELLDGRKEPKSDVWPLGMTLIELAEGQNPYAGLSSAAVMKAILMSEPPALSSSKWPAEFVDFVSKCLVKDVRERWGVKQLMEVRVFSEEL